MFEWCGLVSPSVSVEKTEEWCFFRLPPVSCLRYKYLDFSSVISDVITTCFLLKALLLYKPFFIFLPFLTFREGNLQGVKREAVFCKEYI